MSSLSIRRIQDEHKVDLAKYEGAAISQCLDRVKRAEMVSMPLFSPTLVVRYRHAVFCCGIATVPQPRISNSIRHYRALFARNQVEMANKRGYSIIQP